MIDVLIPAKSGEIPDEAKLMMVALDHMREEDKLRKLTIDTELRDAFNRRRVGRVLLDEDMGDGALSAMSFLSGLSRGELEMIAAAGLKLYHQALNYAKFHEDEEE